MVVHNLIIVNYHMLEARERQGSGRKVTRFDLHQLIQHHMLSLSFISLVHHRLQPEIPQRLVGAGPRRPRPDRARAPRRAPHHGGF